MFGQTAGIDHEATPVFQSNENGTVQCTTRAGRRSYEQKYRAVRVEHPTDAGILNSAAAHQ
jgi:hypothetical protein